MNSMKLSMIFENISIIFEEIGSNGTPCRSIQMEHRVDKKKLNLKVTAKI